MDKKKLIEELEYAKEIHEERSIDLRFDKNIRRIDKRIVGQKEVTIQMLKGNIPATDNIIRVVKRWRNIHLIWEKYTRYYETHKDQLTKEIAEKIKTKGGGTSRWDRRWIRVYDEALKILEKNKAIGVGL